MLDAADGPEALDVLANVLNPDLLFTDVVMPGMTGRRLADLAKQKLPKLKVLYTTGYTRNALVHNGVLHASTNLLAKPFSIDQLALKVREILDER